MNFYSPSLCRKVRVAGPVAEPSVEASTRDRAEWPAVDGSTDPDGVLYAGGQTGSSSGSHQ